MANNKKLDNLLLFATLALVVFGLIMISSAGIAYSKTRFGDPYYFFKRQLVGAGIGLMVMYLVQKIDYNFWRRISFPMFVASVIGLILVFVPGVGNRIYGASRWIQLGPLSFQPAEMLKLSLVLYLAAWLETRREKVKDFYEGLIPFLTIIAILGFLLIKQPDMGTMGVVVLLAIMMFFSSGSRMSHIALIASAGFAAFLALVKAEAYRFNRLLVFLHPELDPRGMGYQINQALLAIGSGGIFGVGLGQSLQKFNYLPEPVGDSIFAIIGEELGLIGALIVIIFFLIIAIRGLKIARLAPDIFSQLVAVGVVSWIFLQAFINMAAISGLIPLTGVPLPFISYGGTSIIFLMAGVGILLNISKQIKHNQI